MGIVNSGIGRKCSIAAKSTWVGYLAVAVRVSVSGRVNEETTRRVELQARLCVLAVAGVDAVRRLVVRVQQMKHGRRRQAPVTTCTHRALTVSVNILQLSWVSK